MAFNWKFPSESVTTSRTAAVDAEVSLTATPAMGLPLLSVTVPVMEPVTICAEDGAERTPESSRQPTSKSTWIERIVNATVYVVRCQLNVSISVKKVYNPGRGA